MTWSFLRPFSTPVTSVAVAIVALVTSPAWAVNDSAGTTSFNFLKIGVGARPTALGGAFTAVRGDLEASSWNPAGLHGLEQRSGVLSLSSYLVDTEAGFLSIAAPGEHRTWALSVNYVTYGTMRRTDVDGADLGTFSAFDVATYITAAQPLWNRRLTVGVNFKAIYSSIDDYSSDAYVVDLGVIAPGPLAGMDLGASLLNIGGVRSGFTDGYKDSLPVMMRLGVSHRPAHAPRPLMLLADLNVPNDNDAYLTFGAEMQVHDGLYVRPGYSLRQSGVEGDEPLGLTAGAGFVFQKYRIDYAFSTFPALGDVHRISVAGDF
jgi:hypothetical protein